MDVKSSQNTAVLYENILESMDNGVLALDFEGRIMTFNQAASKILGIDADQALGKYYPEVFFQGPGNDEFNDVLINVIDSRQTHFYREVSFVREQDQMIPLGITSSLLKDEQGNDYGVVSVFSDLTEVKKRQFFQDTLTRYVTKQVVELILENPDTIVLDGEEREATVLFSDIRGFTGIAENMQPKELVGLLREYFTLMVEAVFQFQGTVDKFIGDALMSIFGAPQWQPNHAELAIRTALEMLRQLEGFNARRRQDGQPPIDIGVGINTGAVVVGNIGSEARLDYTAIGDAVNLASRLEGINKQYGTQIVISEFTYQEVKDSFVERELDKVRVKGKRAPVTIYEVLGESGTLPNSVEHKRDVFVRGLHHYRHREWKTAETCFQEVLRSDPTDRPSQLYVERCAVYAQHPPPDKWDGVFEMTSK
jgi:adenylate cyclase